MCHLPCDHNLVSTGEVVGPAGGVRQVGGDVRATDTSSSCTFFNVYWLFSTHKLKLDNRA